MSKATKKPFTLPKPKYEVGDFVQHMGKNRQVVKIIPKAMWWDYELKNIQGNDTYIIAEHNIK